MYKKLSLGYPTPSRISISLADKRIQHPEGVIANILVKVTYLVFPVDFLILYMEENFDFPLILGQPFLYTSRALINMDKGKLCMRVRENEDVLKFSITLGPSSNNNDTMFYTNHTNNKVSYL